MAFSLMTTHNESIIRKLNDGLESGVFPSAELLVAKDGNEILHERVGYNPTLSSFFDLASLTKPLCTAILVALLRQSKKLKLRNTVDDYFESFALAGTPIYQLLNHTSGFIDWYPFYANMIEQDRQDYGVNKSLILSKILNSPEFVTTPGKVKYSDLGYILLGGLIEKIEEKPLNEVFYERVTKPLGISNELFFVPLKTGTPFDKSHFIPTEECPVRNRTIQGEVMDRNCHVMGGVSGHAGLFGTANAIHIVLQELRLARLGQGTILSQSSFDKFMTPDPDRSFNEFYFTLGFDTPTQGKSQSGSELSKSSIGHLGYAGTSFWWDLENDYWIILLTNRCMPNRKNFKIQKFRPDLYDHVGEILKLNS